MQDSGADWTVLRSSWFCQNFSEGLFVDQLLSGELALPVDWVREPFVDVDDLADIAVAALTDDSHVGQLYELTGPRLLTFAEAVDAIARATGREIRFRSLSPEHYASSLAEQDVPPDVVSLVQYLFTEVLDGRNAHIADGVQSALGRPARDFTDYVIKAAATGVWGGRCARSAAFETVSSADILSLSATIPATRRWATRQTRASPRTERHQDQRRHN